MQYGQYGYGPYGYGQYEYRPYGYGPYEQGPYDKTPAGMQTTSQKEGNASPCNMASPYGKMLAEMQRTY